MSRIAVIAGDGIGREVIREAVRVLRHLSPRLPRPLDLVDWPHGADHFLATGTSITDAEVDDLRSSYRAILLGALGDPRIPDHRHARDILLGLRSRLDLYVNLRPCRLFDRRLTPLRDRTEEDLDLVIFRENTEGVYVGMGGVFRRGTPEEIAIQEEVNTRRGVERILRAAFLYAREHGLQRVTMADKANAMEHAGGLWRRTFAEVGADFPEVEREAVFVDTLAMDLVRRPERYRVIVTGNLFGDILSDLCAQLAGGLGLAPSANLHPGRTSLFEPVHGSAPELAGMGVANPFAAILSAGLLLEHLGHASEARAVERAVRGAVRAGECTADLGGPLDTAAAGEAVLRRLDGADARPS